MAILQGAGVMADRAGITLPDVPGMLARVVAVVLTGAGCVTGCALGVDHDGAAPPVRSGLAAMTNDIAAGAVAVVHGCTAFGIELRIDIDINCRVMSCGSVAYGTVIVDRRQRHMDRVGSGSIREAVA